MSKNWLKSGLKKAKADAQPIPREVKDIQAEYTDLCGKLGHATYQKTFNETVISAILKRLEELDREGTVRKQLDAKNAEVKVEPKQEEQNA